MTQDKYKFESCIYSDSLLNKIKKFNNDAIKQKKDQVDITYIKKGISFAKYYHGSQARKSGEPYYSHPIIVARMVANNIFRSNAIIGALLHDTIEDTALTLSEIEYEFSPRIAQIVGRLTRSIDPTTGKKMSAGECLLKSFELRDDEALLIKMIDRWHNTSTIASLSKEKQEKIINETIEYFTFLFLYGKYINNSNKINEILVSSLEHLGIKTKYFDMNSILFDEHSYFDKNFYSLDLQNKIFL